jgi:hypothetical protein
MVTTSLTMEQRRPMPILGQMNVDQAREAKKVRGLPGYACSTCALGPECPEFQEGYVCAFEGAFAAFPVRDADSVMSLMAEVVDTNKSRWRMALLQERISSGGMADPNVTRLGEVVLSQAQALVDLQSEVNKVTISVAGPRDEAQKATGGILSKLFGGAPTQPLVQAPDPVPVLDMNPITHEPELITRAQDTRALVVRQGPDEHPPGSNEGEVVGLAARDSQRAVEGPSIPKHNEVKPVTPTESRTVSDAKRWKDET